MRGLAELASFVQVKLAGTAGVRVEELTAHRSVIKVANVKRVTLRL